MTLSSKLSAPFIAMAVAGLIGQASAETNREQKPGLSIELSTAEEAPDACRLSFVVSNTLGTSIEQAVFETVLFDAKGQVSQLTLLDFQDLPAGRLRVRQFQFPQLCSDISRVLINGASTCQGEGIAQGACSDNLRLLSREKMELAG